MRIAVTLIVALGSLAARAPAQTEKERVVPTGSLIEFVEPAPLAKASAEEKAMFADVRKSLLATAARKPLVFSRSSESGFFIMAHRMGPLMDAYAYSRDVAFIDALVPLIENVVGQRYEHPTQPEVWSGWWHYRDSTLKAMGMHASIMYWQPALKLVAAVRADPKLKAEYGKQAEAWYTDIVERDIPRWDRNGALSYLIATSRPIDLKPAHASDIPKPAGKK